MRGAHSVDELGVALQKTLARLAWRPRTINATTLRARQAAVTTTNEAWVASISTEPHEGTLGIDEPDGAETAGRNDAHAVTCDQIGRCAPYKIGRIQFVDLVR